VGAKEFRKQKIEILTHRGNLYQPQRRGSLFYFESGIEIRNAARHEIFLYFRADLQYLQKYIVIRKRKYLQG